MAWTTTLRRSVTEPSDGPDSGHVTPPVVADRPPSGRRLVPAAALVAASSSALIAYGAASGETTFTVAGAAAAPVALALVLGWRAALLSFWQGPVDGQPQTSGGPQPDAPDGTEA